MRTAGWWAVAGVAAALCGVHADSRNLVDVISTRRDLSQFVHLLQRTRLLPTLNRMQELDEGQTGMTLFAPNNAAFEEAMQGDSPRAEFWRQALQDEPSDNIHAALRQQLWYHVVNYTLSEPGNGVELHETLHFPSRKRLEEPTHPGPIPQPPSGPPHPGAEDHGGLLAGYGQLLRTAKVGRTTKVGVDANGRGGATVTDTDRSSSRGVVMVTDAILDLPPTLMALLQTAPQVARVFSQLSNKTLHTLSTTAHMTMFLPSENALATLSPLEQEYIQGPWAEADEDRLKLFAWHASSIGLGNGKVGYAYRLRDAHDVDLTTVLGGEMHVRAADGTIDVGGARVVEEDILTENGVVHTVDDLHLPFGDLGMTPEKYLLVLRAVRFVRLLRETGLAHYVDQDPHEPPREEVPQGAFTIVAPSDEALDRWLDAQRRSALVVQHAPHLGNAAPVPDMHELRQLLLYHILPGHLPNGTRERLLSTELHTPKLGGGAQRIVLERAAANTTLGGVVMDSAPIRAGNTTIYLASDVLPVPGSVVSAAAASFLTTYVAAAQGAGLQDALRAVPNTTYLVPHDEAFAELGLVTKYLLLPAKQSREDMANVLQHHAVRGIHYNDTLGTQWAPFPTHTNETVRLRVSRGRIEAQWADKHVAQSSAVDRLTETGVLHSVDRVSYPPTLSISMEKLLRAANASEMLRLVRRTGFDWVLDREVPHDTGSRCAKKTVLLVPTDAAFARMNLTYYESDEMLLRTLVAQHILLVDDCGKKRRASRLRLPISLQDDAVHVSLLDRSEGGTSQHGALAFRRVGRPSADALGYVVGVLGTRGTSGGRHYAHVLDFGSVYAHEACHEALCAGGIFTLDSVIEPYLPGWFFRWGWLSLVGLLGVVALCSGGAYVYLCMRSRGYRQIPDALEGEEE